MPIVRTVLADDRAEALLGEIGELYAIVLRIARQVHDSNEPMTATQRLALIEVVSAGPLRLRQLARLMNTTPATATRAVDALEEWGYVARRPSPIDGRGVLVASTPRGKRWSERRRALLLARIAQLAPAEAPVHLVSDLEKLNAGLRAVTGHDQTSRQSLLAPQ